MLKICHSVLIAAKVFKEKTHLAALAHPIHHVSFITINKEAQEY
jgi:hypothetical protein